MNDKYAFILFFNVIHFFNLDLQQLLIIYLLITNRIFNKKYHETDSY